MRILALIIAVAMLSGGINPVMADDNADKAASDSWHEYLNEMPCDMFVQIDDDSEQPQFPPGQPGMHRQQRKYIEQLRILKMLELLDIDSDHEISFLTSYNNLRSDIRQINDARMKLLTELGDNLNNETGTDSEIKSLLEQIDANQQEKLKVEAEFIEHVSTILTVRQLGKLVIFNEHFERELLDRVRAFREGKMGRKLQNEP